MPSQGKYTGSNPVGSANKNNGLASLGRETPELSLATAPLIVSVIPALVRRLWRSNARTRGRRSATGRQNLLRNEDGNDQPGSHGHTQRCNAHRSPVPPLTKTAAHPADPLRARLPPGEAADSVREKLLHCCRQ